MDSEQSTLVPFPGSNLQKYYLPDALSIPGSFSLLSTSFQSSRYDGLMKKLVEGIQIAAGATGALSTGTEALGSTAGSCYFSLLGPLQNASIPGLFRGVFYTSGKIAKHGLFVPVELIGTASTCASMAILVTVAIEVHEIRRILDEVQRAIENVKELMHNDRIGEIVAGIYQFQQSFEVKDPHKKQELLVHAIQMLNEGIVKAIISLKNEISDVPPAATRLPNILHVSKIKGEAWHKMGLAEETLGVVLYGIQALAECYSFMDEPSAAAHSLRTSISALGSVGIDEAIEKSRMLPYDGKILPETPWLAYKEKAPLALEAIEKLQTLGEIADKDFELEVVEAAMFPEVMING